MYRNAVDVSLVSELDRVAIVQWVAVPAQPGGVRDAAFGTGQIGGPPEQTVFYHMSPPTHIMSISRIQSGLKPVGGSGAFYTLLSPIVRGKPPNVWRAFRSENERDEVIIKHRQDDTDSGKGCFQREMDM